MRRTKVVVLSGDMFAGNLKLLPPWMEKTFVTLAERLKAADVRLAERGP